MYSIDQSEIGEQFCLLAQRARKSKKILRLKHEYVWGYLLEKTNHRGNYEHTDPIDVFIDYLEPCCLFHALADLEEEFHEINKQKYKQECETRTYFVEVIEKVTEDNKKIEVVIFCGT
tara:strand:+ start:116 stop:469 length:354 start_codon:yes stop_codon:yes gene_type:complete